MKNKFKFIKTGFTNSYLLDCNEGYLLIDTGYPDAYKTFLQKLSKNYQIGISEIKYLLLTHHHDDHVGFAAELIENCGAKLITHENTFENLKKGASEEDGIPINRRMKIILKIFSHFHEFKFPPLFSSDNDIIIKDSKDNTEILRNLGIDGTILFTPGHTHDGISLVLSDGSIFPGDNAMNAWLFNIFGIKKRPIYQQNMNLIFDSWERYIDLGGKIVYPAHGKPFNIKHLEKNLSQFRPKGLK